MKKVILGLTTILAIVFITLSILGREEEYPAEKIFYNAMKMNEKIVMNPDVAPPKMVAAVEKNLTKLLKKYPNCEMAKSASLALAEFYVYNKRYDKALDAFNMLMKKYNKDDTIMSNAHFLKGNMYERQGMWNKALTEYNILRDKYSDTKLGLQIPMYIGRRYKDKGEISASSTAYNDAAVFYERLEKANAGKPLGYMASMMAIEAYLNLEQFDEAGRVFEKTVDNYPYIGNIGQLVPYIDYIYIEKLKNKKKALDIYKKIKAKVNNERIEKLLQKRIDELTAKK